MPETTKKPRSRSTKNELTTAPSALNNDGYEYNSYYGHVNLNDLDDIFGCSISTVFTPEEIKMILKNPIKHHALARRLAMYVYNTEGVVTNAIDYMTAMPCLDNVIYGKKRMFGNNKTSKKLEMNKDLMQSVLESINDKQFIRDVLFTDMNEGTTFYYFETTQKVTDNVKYMTDYDVENIMEICDLGMNAVMIPLPYSYTKIVGRKNGRYVIAFDLTYFEEVPTFEERQRKLKKYPKEIRSAYIHWLRGGKSTGNWVVLNNDHTFVHKIKSKVSEPWGRPLAIAAIPDILYQNEFVDTKRNVLRELNNKVIYQTLPEGKDKGSCALTRSQQEDQHNKVKDAVLRKNNRGGTSFFTVAAGTKIDTLDVSTSDIFNEKNEKDLTDKIALDMGMAAQLLGASSSGTFASGQHNLEMVNAQIYSWIQEIQNELNHIINACVIKDRKNRVEVYYLPTSLVNRKNFFDYMKSLYLEAGGSLTMLLAATGVKPEAYLSVLDEEIDNHIFDKYRPHITSYNSSYEDIVNKTDNQGGRPEVDNPTNENTIKSKTSNSNDTPKPSTS